MRGNEKMRLEILNEYKLPPKQDNSCFQRCCDVIVSINTLPFEQNVPLKVILKKHQKSKRTFCGDTPGILMVS